MAYRKYEPEKWTGRLAEREAFEAVVDAVEWEEWKEQKHDFMTEEEALADVMDRQPSDPKEPKAYFANYLRQYLASILEQLQLGSYAEVNERLKFYTAVGTYADYASHVATDAFFDYEVSDGVIRVTLGVSTYDKGGDTKTDVDIVYPKSLDPEGDEHDRQIWMKLL